MSVVPNELRIPETDRDNKETYGEEASPRTTIKNEAIGRKLGSQRTRTTLNNYSVRGISDSNSPATRYGTNTIKSSARDQNNTLLKKPPMGSLNKKKSKLPKTI